MCLAHILQWISGFPLTRPDEFARNDECGLRSLELIMPTIRADHTHDPKIGWENLQ
jgi:hypothetical protein